VIAAKIREVKKKEFPSIAISRISIYSNRRILFFTNPKVKEIGK